MTNVLHNEVEFSEWLFKMKQTPNRPGILKVNWGEVMSNAWRQVVVSRGFNAPKCNLCGIPFKGGEEYDFYKTPSTGYVFHQNDHCSPRQYAKLG